MPISSRLMTIRVNSDFLSFSVGEELQIRTKDGLKEADFKQVRKLKSDLLRTKTDEGYFIRTWVKS